MSNKFIAVANNIFVKRNEAETERNGLLIPNQAQKKLNKGVILSVGKKVIDKGIQEGREIVWNQFVGDDIELDGEVITVLSEDQVLGVK